MPLFLETMSNMFTVFKRMAYWAQNFQVIWSVVSVVAVFMVDAKNFWVRVVATPLAFFYGPPPNHCLSNRGKRGRPKFLFCFVNTLFRAVFSFMRRRVQKSCAAVRTFVLRGPFLGHGLPVTHRRTIFSFIGSAGDVGKLCGAHRAC
jgi:hypothetical protein